MDKQELKVSFDRLKRILANQSLCLASLNEVFRFKFPVFSWVCLLGSLITTWVVQVNDLLSYLLCLLVVYILSQHPHLHLTHLLSRLFFQPNHLNPTYSAPLVQTTFQKNTQTNQSFSQ